MGPCSQLMAESEMADLVSQKEPARPRTQFLASQTLCVDDEALCAW